MEMGWDGMKVRYSRRICQGMMDPLRGPQRRISWGNGNRIAAKYQIQEVTKKSEEWWGLRATSAYAVVFALKRT